MAINVPLTPPCGTSQPRRGGPQHRSLYKSPHTGQDEVIHHVGCTLTHLLEGDVGELRQKGSKYKNYIYAHNTNLMSCKQQLMTGERDLGVICIGGETCNLGVYSDDAEVRVYFLN